MKHIKTEAQLIEYLQKITSDSFLNEAGKALPSDPFEADFERGEKANDGLFEQEDEEEDEDKEEEDKEEEDKEEEDKEEDEDSEEDSDEDSDDSEDDEDDLNPAAKKALKLPDYESGQEVSFEQILTAINLVRAGNSTKDKKTREEIKDYYERLDSEEKSVLLIYLKEFAKIMTGAVDGDEAQDPSEPKAYFDIVTTKKEEESEEESDSSESDSDPIIKRVPDVSQKGLEDTSPPIKVNERQDLAEVKRKFNLLSR